MIFGVLGKSIKKDKYHLICEMVTFSFCCCDCTCCPNGCSKPSFCSNRNSCCYNLGIFTVIFNCVYDFLRALIDLIMMIYGATIIYQSRERSLDCYHDWIYCLTMTIVYGLTFLWHVYQASYDKVFVKHKGSITKRHLLKIERISKYDIPLILGLLIWGLVIYTDIDGHGLCIEYYKTGYNDLWKLFNIYIIYQCISFSLSTILLSLNVVLWFYYTYLFQN